MTNEELDRLAALANAATPGPWVYVTDGELSVECAERLLPTGYSTHCVARCYGKHVGADVFGKGDCYREGTFENAAFIAAARDAVPALVEEVRRLQQDAARWAFIRDSGQLAVKAMRLLDGSDITEGFVGGPYADAAVDAMIAKEERRKALEGV